MAHDKVKVYFTFFFAIRGDESRTFSTSYVIHIIVTVNRKKLKISIKLTSIYC